MDNIKLLKTIIKKVPMDKLNKVHKKGDTFLLMACKSNNNTNLIKCLIDIGVELNTKDSNGKTALVYCIENNLWEIARKLLKKQVIFDEYILYNLNLKNNFFDYSNCVYDTITHFLKNKAVFNSPEKGCVFIHWSKNFALNMFEIMIKALIDYDQDNLNRVGCLTGNTLLIEAIEKGHHELAMYLINKGADIHFVDKWGYNALYYACTMTSCSCEFNMHEIIEYLIKNKCVIPQQGKNHIIFSLIRNYEIDLINLLFDYDQSLKNLKNKDNLHPLVYISKQFSINNNIYYDNSLHYMIEFFSLYDCKEICKNEDEIISYLNNCNKDVKKRINQEHKMKIHLVFDQEYRW